MKNLLTTFAKVVLLLMLPALVSAAYALDVWGFHSGMSESEAAAVAKQLGYDADNPEISGHVHRVMYRAPDARGAGYSKGTIGYSASFCNGHMTWLSRHYTGTMSTLYDVLDEVGREYGKHPVLLLHSEMTADGKIRSFNFDYPNRPDDITRVGVTMGIGADDFVVQVIHQVAPTACR